MSKKEERSRRYISASKIAVLAWIVLSNQSYRRALDDLKRLNTYRRIGLEKVLSPASSTGWETY
ncbi:MAG: hypothetical protein ACTSX9_06895 [Candidatus Njordarchaeales archaeon]